ncbi:ribbon-helix-helix domain-containing protein [Halospeciosus flavus]|uniref:Ribbon-helix-helix domain-containing protein n=4 Tax=Halospeciosus flavus TaxID=3032283 RepID=A0ABD5ZA75_9EURY|nr:ribbon-helix-helix domain-containing protein [Halospeciosus flavus]
MPRVTVRVEDELKEKMDEQEQVNWSEFIRQSIRERVSESDRRQIQKLVREYDGDLPRLFTLYMFAERISKNHIYETMERLFDEDHDKLVDDVENDIDELHLPKMYKKTPDGERYSDLIIEEVETLAGDAIRTYVRDRIAEAPEVTKEGVSLLPHFVRNRRNDDGTSLKQRGLTRTWSIRSNSDVNTDRLLGTGLAFADYYRSNAYSYSTYRIPGYALDILDELERHPTQFKVPVSHPDTETVAKLKQSEAFDVFLSWMDGMTKRIPKHGETEEIQEFLSDYDLMIDQFEDMRKQLIENNMLVLEYSPHRSSTGSRSSLPAQWKYRTCLAPSDFVTVS